MIRRPPRSTRTDTLFPYTTLFRSLIPPGELVMAVHNLGDREPGPDAAPIRVAIVDDSTVARAMMGWTLEKRSEEHTSELQSLMRISYAVFCLKKKKKKKKQYNRIHHMLEDTKEQSQRLEKRE